MKKVIRTIVTLVAIAACVALYSYWDQLNYDSDSLIHVTFTGKEGDDETVNKIIRAWDPANHVEAILEGAHAASKDFEGKSLNKFTKDKVDLHKYARVILEHERLLDEDSEGCVTFVQKNIIYKASKDAEDDKGKRGGRGRGKSEASNIAQVEVCKDRDESWEHFFKRGWETLVEKARAPDESLASRTQSELNVLILQELQAMRGVLEQMAGIAPTIANKTPIIFRWQNAEGDIDLKRIYHPRYVDKLEDYILRAARDHGFHTNIVETSDKADIDLDTYILITYSPEELKKKRINFVHKRDGKVIYRKDHSKSASVDWPTYLEKVFLAIEKDYARGR